MTSHDDKLETLLKGFRPVGPRPEMQAPWARPDGAASGRTSGRLWIGMALVGLVAGAAALLFVLSTRPPTEAALSGTVAPAVAASPRAAFGQGPESPVRVGGDVAAPRRIRQVEPSYPRDPEPGPVAVLEVTGNPEGRIAEVRVLRDLQGMDLTSAAVEAVSQWEYEPLELGGEPVWFLMTVIVPPAARAQDSEGP